MINSVRLPLRYTPSFKSDEGRQSLKNTMPDADKFNRMVDEQQKAIKKEEKRRDRASVSNFLITGAFLAMAGITVYQFIKGRGSGSKTVFQKLGDNIPDYTDDCVNKYVKQTVKQRLELAKKSPEVLEHLGLKGKANMYVFYGAPGTGKSLSAQIMAKALNANYAEIQFSELSSAFIGETSVHITNKFKEIYKLAKKNPNKQYVITFNEIDSLINNVATLGANNEHLGQNRTAFLNGLDLIKDCPNVTIIGTTNINPNSAKLDPATLSRLGNIVEIGLPDVTELKACLKYHLKKAPVAKNLMNNDKDLQTIAETIYQKQGTQRDTAKIIESAISEFGYNVNDTTSQLELQNVMDAINNKKVWSAAIAADSENTLHNVDLSSLLARFAEVFGLKN